ncbi:BrnA antitoxin family protein [Sediminispirochaeta bajacaliforniensis]|uniref:BrnA antitoxin family protein n=1 Tax=Sediminispirochaeta bajacaliforniensis TaxID=148 RepID=UPI0003713576|nr:BrnA antitoxin family protein [Sediminispirochaeta bajacaliforniensis]
MEESNTETNKKSTTLRPDENIIEYFKELSSETGISYQALINLYLKRCTEKKMTVDFILTTHQDD